MKPVFAFLLSTIVLFGISCNESSRRESRKEAAEDFSLKPIWSSYKLPELDSNYARITEDFFDGTMSILGTDHNWTRHNDYTIAYSGRTDMDTVYQWCYEPHL